LIKRPNHFHLLSIQDTPMNRFIVCVTMLCMSSASATQATDESFAAGDPCAVATRSAPLQKGDDILARVPRGTRFTVLRTQDDWVRVAFVVDGKPIEGWIDRAHLVHAPSYNRNAPVKVSETHDRIARAITVLELSDDPATILTGDVARTLAKIKDEAAALKAIAKMEGDWKDIASEAFEELTFLAKLVRTIAEHPDAAGLPRETLKKETVGLKPLPAAEVETHEVAPNSSLNVLLLQYCHAIDEMRALGLRAAKLANKTCGPRVVQGQVLVIGFTEANGFEFPQANGLKPDPFAAPDRLALTNVSDQALTRCTVLVEIQGKNEDRAHMHFVPTWKPGQTLWATYYAGALAGKKPLLRFTCKNVLRVTVSVCCEQCRQDGIVFHNTDSEKEQVFREYVGRARVVAECKRYAGVLESGYRIGISFDEVPHLPGAKLSVRIKRNDQWSEKELPSEPWRAGDARMVDFPDENGDVKPSEFEVILTSALGGWTQRREWHWENK
jgi:hypothetical protein